MGELIWKEIKVHSKRGARRAVPAERTGEEGGGVAPGGEDSALALDSRELKKRAGGARGGLLVQLCGRLLRQVQVPRQARLLHPRRCTKVFVLTA